MNNQNATPLALFGALLGVFSEIHPFGDQWVQDPGDAQRKGLHGDERLYADGVAVGAETSDRTGWPTLTATQLGRRCCARHVASYTATQLAATVAVTRALGYRVPAGALLVGAAVNGLTHYAIDRRRPLIRLASARPFRKAGYIEHCQAVRLKEDGTPKRELAGPGSALMELDQALHRVIGVAAAALTAWIAARSTRTR